ncbi:MAG: hypothetical protein J0L88_00600 [Xanthomonadales bacterium]|nr:hypothetical protein [Xanthomonadales bacterium]
MNRIRFLRIASLSALALLAACQSSPRRADPVVAGTTDWRESLVGEYDNNEQVEQARPTVVPHLRLVVEAMPTRGWFVWRTRLHLDSVLEATWLLRADTAADGSLVLVPHRPLAKDAATGTKFDAAQWVALDACALRAPAPVNGLAARADAAACATVAPGVGVEAALLPLSIEQHGEIVRVRVYADQARGADAKSVARRVQWFGGWAAINGAGDKATAESRDWHMDKGLRLDNEGGRASLKWRDGTPSGHSLRLERLTYRDGSTPVLKLSLVEDASGQAIAYAWANPEATSIGLNLGWVQVGLTRETGVPKP